MHRDFATDTLTKYLSQSSEMLYTYIVYKKLKLVLRQLVL